MGGLQFVFSIDNETHNECIGMFKLLFLLMNIKKGFQKRITKKEKNPFDTRCVQSLFVRAIKRTVFAWLAIHWGRL